MWHGEKNTRHTFVISKAETLAGRLGHSAETQPWLRFIMISLYSSLAHALGESRAHLIISDKAFRALLKHVRKDLRFHKSDHQGHHGKPAQHNSQKQMHGYALLQTSKKIHHSRTRFLMNRTLRCEIKLIFDAFSSDWIDPWRPLEHMIPRDPSGTAWSNSSLHAAGGYS